MELKNITEANMRERIKTDLSVNCFVEAGAGAGKTTIIKKRIVNLLKNGAKPEEIVAITFTNAASRELKDRIFEEAEDSLKDPTITPKEKANLESALEELDRMQISTIHAFCHRLLEEKCFDVGLPMGFHLMQEQEEAELFVKFFVRWAEKNVSFEDWEGFALIAEKHSTAFSRMRALAMDLSKLAPDMRVKVSGKNDDEEVLRKRADDLIGEIEKKLDKAAAEGAEVLGVSKFRQLPDRNLSKDGKSLRYALETQDNTIGILKCLSKLSDTSEKFPLYMPATQAGDYYKNTIVAEKGKKAKKDKTTPEGLEAPKEKTPKELRDEAKAALLKKIKEANQNALNEIHNKRGEIQELLVRFRQPAYRKMVELAEAAAKEYREFFPAGRMTNDLLLQRTLELLEGEEEVRDYFAEKFKYYYVDEFQDTDHIQEKFIRLLAQQKGKPDTLRDGALFVVGDPKQSIYRFRGAEPEVYFRTKEWMIGLPNAIVVELGDNYRSNEAIINWVNKEFENKKITGTAPYVKMNFVDRNADADKTVTDGKPLLQGVYRYSAPEKEPEIEEDEAGEAPDDAVCTCELIQNLLTNARIMKDGRPEQIQPKDILLLTVNMPGMEPYAKELQKAGVPFVMTGKMKAGEDYYINAFICLYAWMAEPYDKRARCGALEALGVSGAGETAENMAILDRIRKETKNYSAYGCLRYLMENKALFLRKNSELNSYEMAMLQRRLLQMTENVMAQEHEDRASVLRALREYQSGEIERELIPEENANAVRFMNLHKAKGLEGGIVILTNRREDRNYREGVFRDGKDYYPVILNNPEYNKSIEWCAYSLDKDVVKKAMEVDEGERIRLEYVAATRAKEVLIFMDELNPDGCLFREGYDLDCLDSINELLSKNATAQNVSSVTAEDAGGTPAVFPMKKQETRLKEKKEAGKLAEIVFSSESPSKYEDEKAGRRPRTKNEEETVIMQEIADGNSEPEKSSAGNGTAASERPKGNIFGTAMHRCFELLVQRRGGKGAAVSGGPDVEELCIRQAVMESAGDITPEERENYRSFLREIMKAFGAQLLEIVSADDVEKIYTELPFSYLDERKDAASVWMHGEADLVIRKKDGTCHVIDYKSDDDTNYQSEEDFLQHLRGKYTPQIEAYCQAIGRVFEIDPGKITAELISFSWKDTEGRSIRIRRTRIQ